MNVGIVHGPSKRSEKSTAWQVTMLDVVSTESGNVRIQIRTEDGRALWVTLLPRIARACGLALVAAAEEEEN